MGACVGADVRMTGSEANRLGLTRVLVDVAVGVALGASGEK